MGLLKKIYSEIQSALSDHKQYIIEYCDRLCNQIDIEVLKFEQKIKSKNKETDELLNDIRMHHELMINEIKKFKQDSLLKVEAKSITCLNDLTQEIVDLIDENYKTSNKKMIIDNIYTLLEERLTNIQDQIFVNKGFLFLPVNNIKNIKPHEDFKESLFGTLVVFEGFFVFNHLFITERRVLHDKLECYNKIDLIKQFILHKLHNVKSDWIMRMKLKECSLLNFEMRESDLISINSNLFTGFEMLKTINLSWHSLTSLPAGVFKGLKNLEYINLANNYLEELSPNIFNGLCNLKTLILNTNPIMTLPDGIFSGLEKLETIELRRIRIDELSSNTFNGLISLEHINLSVNPLETLPDGIFEGLLNLQSIQLNFTELKELNPNIFKGLYNLKEIYLGDNKLESLAANVFEGLHNLEILDLSHNRLESLPDNLIKDLKNLKHFFTERNLKKLLDSSDPEFIAIKNQNNNDHKDQSELGNQEEKYQEVGVYEEEEAIKVQNKSDRIDSENVVQTLGNKLERKASGKSVEKPDNKRRVVNQDESSLSYSSTNLTSESTKIVAIIPDTEAINQDANVNTITQQLTNDEFEKDSKIRKIVHEE